MRRLILNSLRHRPVRIATTVISVAIATGVLVVALALMERLTQVIGHAEHPRILVTPAVSATMPRSYLSRLQRFATGGDIELYSMFHAKDASGISFPVWAASDGFGATYPSALYKVDPAEEAGWRADRRGVIVGESTLASLGKKLGDPITVKGSFGEASGTIDGVNHGYLDHVVFHYDSFNELLPAASRDRVKRFSLACAADACLATAAAIDAELGTAVDPTNTMRQETFLESINHSIAAIPKLLTQIALLVVLITALIAGNTLSMSMRERRSELGTLRALGFTRSRIVALVIAESVAVAFVGGVIGAALPFILYGRGGFPAGGAQLSNVVVTPGVCMISMLVALLIGLVISIVPAITVARRDPLDLLAST